MDLQQLQAAIQYLKSCSLYPQVVPLRTATVYKFLSAISPLTTENTILLFITSLAQSKLAQSTIKAYLSAVRSLHIQSGLLHKFSSQLSPRVEMILRGIKKEQSEGQSPRIRLPITIEIMYKIQQLLQGQSNDYYNSMIWAACCIAFFGFLRCSEFTTHSQQEYDPHVHLQYKDVAVDCRNNPNMVRVQIKQLKTDPFWQGVTLSLGKTGCTVCPVTGILPYLTARGSHPGPLFITKNGTYMTRQAFQSSVSALLTRIGLPQKHFNTHSFRIGAAISAKAAHISDVHIQTLGRWRSSAYQAYIKTPPADIAAFSKTLAQQGCS